MPPKKKTTAAAPATPPVETPEQAATSEPVTVEVPVVLPAPPYMKRDRRKRFNPK